MSSSLHFSTKKISLVLACLSCLGDGRVDGRRVTPAMPGLTQKFHTAAGALPALHGLADLNLPTNHIDAAGTLNPLKQLAIFLLRINPAAQFNSQQKPQGASVDPMLIANALQTIAHLSSLKKFPKLTSGVIALNVLAHYRVPLGRKYLGVKDQFPVREYGLQPLRVWEKGGLCWSLVISTFLHRDNRDILNNMWSLLLKGSTFEESAPFRLFLDIIRYAIIAPNAVLVLMTKLWASFEDSPAARAAYAKSTYMDFSGALFCLSTAFNHLVVAPSGQPVRMYGVALPAQIASFVELSLDYVFNPTAPILRKVSGLVAGLFYVYVLPQLRRMLD